MKERLNMKRRTKYRVLGVLLAFALILGTYPGMMARAQNGEVTFEEAQTAFDTAVTAYWEAQQAYNGVWPEGESENPTTDGALQIYQKCVADPEAADEAVRAAFDEAQTVKSSVQTQKEVVDSSYNVWAGMETGMTAEEQAVFEEAKTAYSDIVTDYDALPELTAVPMFDRATGAFWDKIIAFWGSVEEGDDEDGAWTLYTAAREAGSVSEEELRRLREDAESACDKTMAAYESVAIAWEALSEEEQNETWTDPESGSRKGDYEEIKAEYGKMCTTIPEDDYWEGTASFEEANTALWGNLDDDGNPPNGEDGQPLEAIKGADAEYNEAKEAYNEALGAGGDTAAAEAELERLYQAATAARQAVLDAFAALQASFNQLKAVCDDNGLTLDSGINSDYEERTNSYNGVMEYVPETPAGVKWPSVLEAWWTACNAFHEALQTYGGNEEENITGAIWEYYDAWEEGTADDTELAALLDTAMDSWLALGEAYEEAEERYNAVADCYGAMSGAEKTECEEDFNSVIESFDHEDSSDPNNMEAWGIVQWHEASAPPYLPEMRELGNAFAAYEQAVASDAAYRQALQNYGQALTAYNEAREAEGTTAEALKGSYDTATAAYTAVEQAFAGVTEKYNAIVEKYPEALRVSNVSEYNVYYDDWRKECEEAMAEYTTGYEAEAARFKALERPELIKAKVEVEQGAPQTALKTTITELLEAVTLSAAEQAQAAAGSKVDIVLSVANKALTPAEEALLEQSRGDYSIGVYLDIALYLQINGTKIRNITETEKVVSITTIIPENLVNTDPAVTRTYKIIRIHNGETTVLDGTYDPATREFTFATDRFSAYTIVYKDEKAADTNTDTNKPADTNTDTNKPVDTNTDTNKPADTNTDTNKPVSTGTVTAAKTGDDSMLFQWLLVLAAGGCAAIYSAVRIRMRRR